MSVNFLYSYCRIDYIFISNNIRFRELPDHERIKCIITSNIPENSAYLQVNYKDLLNDNEFVRDNSGLMAAKLLMKAGVGHITLAGFDGYSYDVLDNYVEGQRILVTKKAIIDATNQGMSKEFSKISKMVTLDFLTTPIYFNTGMH